MSIQPLSNSGFSTYLPTGTARPASEKSTTAETTTATAGNSQPTEAQSSSKSETKEALRTATQKANQAIAGLGSDLKFTVDDETGSNVVKFVDVKTKEVIRQIPAQEMLVIAKHLDELRGLLIKERA